MKTNTSFSPPRNRLSAIATTLFLVYLAVPAQAQSTSVQPPQTPSASEDSVMTDWRARYQELGHDIYNWACAQCHNEGEQGAPRIRVASDWEERSPLWTAVLLEHVQAGYMDMPAKGGHPYISDRAVQAAGEYLLMETFPHLPAD